MSGLATNRKAYYDFEILEEYEAGIKLEGMEVKALKEGKGSFTESFIIVKENSLWLKGFNLPPFSKAGALLHYNPKRDRKLLLNREEINSLKGKVERQGYSLIPVKFYPKGNLIKLSIALVKGKKKKDKKEELIKKQQDRETERLVKEVSSS